MLLRIVRFLVVIKFIFYLLMSLLDWRRLLFPGPNHPLIPNVRETSNDSLYLDSWTRGILILGSPGSGKTETAAKEILNQAIANEIAYLEGRGERSAIFVLDASGSITRAFIRLVYLQPEPMRTNLINRLVADFLGHPDYVTTYPFFHPEYGTNYEEQAQRVARNYKVLFSALIERTPIMSLSILETLPELNRLLTAMQNELRDPAQLTEAKKLILDTRALRRAVTKYGRLVPEAKYYFEEEFLKLSRHERELRSFALRSVLGNIEPRVVRARVGYPRPAWTPKEADEKGLIVLVSGEEIINQETSQALLFTDVFSQILAHINRRTPHHPNNKPILIAIDEVPMLLQIKGMAKEIGKISLQYRSRNVQIMVIAQALWQFEENLRDQIWSMGNVIVFRIDDFNEAYQISQQLFNYDPEKIKLPAAHETGQPIVEQDRGGYLIAANWLQHLEHRECVMRKYISESQEEEFVSYIRRTTDNPAEISVEELQGIKEWLLRRRAIPIKDALRVVNQKKVIKRPTL